MQSFTLCQQATTEITRSLLSSPLVSTINYSLASQTLIIDVTHQDHSIGITLLLLVWAKYPSVFRIVLVI